MSSRQIATSTLWQIASQITMAALSIVTVKFVAIGLTKELAGTYNSAYGFLQMFGVLADFFLYAVAVREMSKSDQKEKVLGALLALRFGILLFSFSTALLLIWILPAWRGTPLPLAVSIAALVPFFTLLAGIIRSVFQVHYKMHFVFIAEVLQRIFTAGAIGTVVILGAQGSADPQVMYSFLMIGGIGAFILFAISFICGSRFIRIRLCFDSTLLKRLFFTAMPYGIAFLCTALYRQLDVTLIALLRDDFELQNAYYGFVLRMVEMGYLIPTFLLNSTLPMLSERNAKGEETKSLLGKTFIIILTLGSISFLFSALWSRPLVQLLTTSAYLSTSTNAGSDTALRMMSIPMLLNGIITYSFYVLLTKHEWKRLVQILLMGAIASVALNIIMIPQYGFQGAAGVSIAIHVLLASLLLPQAIRAMPMHVSTQQFLRWGMFSVLLAMCLWLYQPLLTSEISTVFSLVSAGILIGVLGLLCGFQKLLVSPK